MTMYCNVYDYAQFYGVLPRGTHTALCSLLKSFTTLIEDELTHRTHTRPNPGGSVLPLHIEERLKEWSVTEPMKNWDKQSESLLQSLDQNSSFTM